MQQNAAGIGCPLYQREAEQRIIELLSVRSFAPFNEIATDILEAVPMRLTQLKGLVNELKKKGAVAFDLPPRKRVPQPETRITLCGQSD